MLHLQNVLVTSFPGKPLFPSHERGGKKSDPGGEIAVCGVALMKHFLVSLLAFRIINSRSYTESAAFFMLIEGLVCTRTRTWDITIGQKCKMWNHVLGLLISWCLITFTRFIICLEETLENSAYPR